MWPLGTLPIIGQIKQAVLLPLVTAAAACLHAGTQGTTREDRPAARRGHE